jgi:hypothetical protein
MIVTSKMEHAMQRQNPDFLRSRVTQPAGIPFRNVRGYCNITGQSVGKTGSSGE